ncbi:MAG: hypothetical protein MJZ13_08660 [Bacteroidales bacterium]|nr:hypothetical protein [Bacteroidales bacterium]
MGKVTIEYPFTDICGKVNKSDSIYFSHLNGKTYIRRIKKPFKGKPTAKQQAITEKFKTLQQRISAILKAGPGNEEYDLYHAQWKANPNDCATLRGYIFKMEFGN